MSVLHPWAKVGLFLKEKREQEGLTQKQLAIHFGLTSPQYVSNWERGVCPPPKSYLPEMCKILKISEKQMVGIILEQTKLELQAVFGSDSVKKKLA